MVMNDNIRCCWLWVQEWIPGYSAGPFKGPEPTVSLAGFMIIYLYLIYV